MTTAVSKPHDDVDQYPRAQKQIARPLNRTTGQGPFACPPTDTKWMNTLPQLRPRRGRHGASSVQRLAKGHARSHSAWDRTGPIQVVCAGTNGTCPEPPVPGCPVLLCGKHLREAYEFAQDYIAARWDTVVRDYVSDLHGRFRPPRAVQQRVGPSCVYFLRLGDRIKIGYSADPQARIASLPHEEVLGIVPGTREDERRWHELLADFRVTGEWFRADPEVLQVLSQVLDQ